jgi:gliding motility-associated-like protein
LGCADTAEYTVQIFPQAEADFTFESYLSCTGILAEMENRSTQAEFYEWLYDSRSVSTEEDPEFVFTYGQTATITLITTTSDGCNDTTEAIVEVGTFEETFNLTIPNVFTPNGDGINDFFEIDINNRLQECTEVRVFNRWGLPVFESDGNYHIWNGHTLNGEEAPPGTYFYVFNINGKEFNGSVQLVR